MSTQNWVELFILVLCIFLAALASGTETALTSVNRLRVRHLAEDGSQRAATLSGAAFPRRAHLVPEIARR